MNKVKLTPEQIKKYNRRKGGECPVCGSGDMSGERMQVDGPTASQDVNCLTCGCTWTDIYRFAGIDPDNIYKKET